MSIHQKTVVPRISICMPNLNNYDYLPAQIESILKQSFADWELIVVDAHSDDGAWEHLIKSARIEPRIRIHQAPRDGIYSGLNRCLRLARGGYIYVATSDDLMAEDCLEKLAAALDSHADCDLAHCPLQAIGDGSTELNEWWSHSSLFALGSRGLLNSTHIRRAPFDGLLHLYGATVYTSLTQLLVRRSIFDRIGLFDERWDSVGDFHWGMRAALVANTVHVPDTWGGWRLHVGQATRSAGVGTREHREKVEEMIDDALRSVWSEISQPVRRGLEGGWRGYFASRKYLEYEMMSRPSRAARIVYLLSQLAGGSGAALSYLKRRLLDRQLSADSPARVVEGWLRSIDCADYLVPI